MRIDNERAREVRITIIEGAQLLGSFDVRLREYAANKLQKQGVHLIKVDIWLIHSGLDALLVETCIFFGPPSADNW